MIKCTNSNTEIQIGHVILFEEYVGIGIKTCEGTIKELTDGDPGDLYIDGFYMDGGDQVPFKWKLMEDYYSNIRLK